jgi:phosphohistidine phosphatase SixA
LYVAILTSSLLRVSRGGTVPAYYSSSKSVSARLQSWGAYGASKGDPQQLVERLRKNHGNQTVLLIGHTDTLPDLLKALGHPVEIKIDAQNYSNIFVVIPKRDGAPTLVRLRY